MGEEGGGDGPAVRWEVGLMMLIASPRVATLFGHPFMIVAFWLVLTHRD